MLLPDLLVPLDPLFLELLELRESPVPPDVLAVMELKEQLSTTTEPPVIPEPQEVSVHLVLREVWEEQVIQEPLVNEVMMVSELLETLELLELKENPEQTAGTVHPVLRGSRVFLEIQEALSPELRENLVFLERMV